MSSLRDEAALDDSEEKSLVSLVKLVAEAETMGSKEAELADCDLSQTHFAVFQKVSYYNMDPQFWMGCEFIDKGEEDPRSYLAQFDEKSGVQMHVFDFEAVAV